MYVDLLDSNNYLLVNKSLIKILGLSGAAYCSELFVIMKKAIRKDKLVDKFYVEVDREYITETVGLSEVEQKALEDAWEKMDLISRSAGSRYNVFNINVEGFLGLISGQSDGETDSDRYFKPVDIEKLKTKLQPKTSEKYKDGKRRGIAKKVKEGLIIENVEVKNKMCLWIDDIVETTDRTVSANQANVVLETLKRYSGGDVEVMLKVLDEAIKGNYINITYAINAYEKNLKNKEVNPSASFRRATGADVSGGEKF